MMPATAPNTGSIQINIIDGTRQPIAADQDSLVRILDGSHKQVVAQWVTGPSIRVTGLEYHDNLDDLCTVFVYSKGYQDAAIYPVRLKQGQTVDANLMLIPKDCRFHFRPWDDIQSVDPGILQLLTNGADNPAQRYSDTLEARPMQLGGMLTIATAIRDIALDDQKSPFDGYYWEIIWDALAQDRFWAWVDARLADRIKKMSDLHAFAEEADAAHWHPGLPAHLPPIGPATRSWKQTRFDVTNVQLTFHENDRTTKNTPQGVIPCVVIEPDIDYYKDLLAHGLLEVLPNAVTHGLTDPHTVYALRWMASLQEGLPAFDPPCTIE
jgi:hypothetical protein